MSIQTPLLLVSCACLLFLYPIVLFAPCSSSFPPPLFISSFWGLSCSDPTVFQPGVTNKKRCAILKRLPTTISNNVVKKVKEMSTIRPVPVFAAWHPLAPETQTSVPSGLTCSAWWQEAHTWTDHIWQHETRVSMRVTKAEAIRENYRKPCSGGITSTDLRTETRFINCHGCCHGNSTHVCVLRKWKLIFYTIH